MGMSESKKQLVIYFNMQDFCDAPASAIWAAVKNDVQGAYGKKNPNRYCKTRKRERETRMQKDGNQNFLIMHLSAQQTQQKKKRERGAARRALDENKLKMKTALALPFLFLPRQFAL
jgi:hypothetical protein